MAKKGCCPPGLKKMGMKSLSLKRTIGRGGK